MPPCNALIEKTFSHLPETPLSYLTTIKGVRVWVKRDDLNHPTISGNKLHKLKYNLLAAWQSQQAVISFGGAYSNHIAALATAGQLFDLITVGIIRGEELHDKTRWSPVLRRAESDGMQLHFVSRDAYRNKTNDAHIQAIIRHYPHAAVIPEGGSNSLAVNGVAECIKALKSQCHAVPTFDPQHTALFSACGTGGTLAGFIEGLYQFDFPIRIVGINVLNNDAQLQTQITQLARHHPAVNWQLINQYTFGGYAKTPPELQRFVTDIQRQFALPLEPIYTGKLVYAVFDLLNQHALPNLHDAIIYHSGGLR
ncbi:1-aminocyclopropane-1-carboxylate deaminase/D-cysteine desulfhydrase [Ostreibacterium oceani]|uniref:Pyridoxal-phosphate dependent enzyme n=1 Tax=Ostreibacterium oceani TaxID=2654998 RepID=A0A6N7EXP6_9GAMM|nr:pyridoxal-phosphate dependent enzyme [Ostreibacterium oceani]MPV86365.1 pyridoxal-phosphate dependent enzyme [Ostreibacterium oceani]